MNCGSFFVCEPFQDHCQASRFWPQSGFEKGLVGLDESQTGSTLSRFLIADERRCTRQKWINTGRDGGGRWRNACKSGTFHTKRKLLRKEEYCVTQAHTHHAALSLSLLRPQLTWGNGQMFNKYTNKNTTASSKSCNDQFVRTSEDWSKSPQYVVSPYICWSLSCHVYRNTLPGAKCCCRDTFAGGHDITSSAATVKWGHFFQPYQFRLNMSESKWGGRQNTNEQALTWQTNKNISNSCSWSAKYHAAPPSPPAIFPFMYFVFFPPPLKL